MTGSAYGIIDNERYCVPRLRSSLVMEMFRKWLSFRPQVQSCITYLIMSQSNSCFQSFDYSVSRFCPAQMCKASFQLFYLRNGKYSL